MISKTNIVGLFFGGKMKGFALKQVNKTNVLAITVFSIIAIFSPFFTNTFVFAFISVIAIAIFAIKGNLS